MDKTELFIERIKILSETIWENKDPGLLLTKWLENFQNDQEKFHALYLLSKFMYFGERQIRELLKALYRDLFRYPIIEKIRESNNNTTDLQLINYYFEIELEKTRFLGMGNPSESGCHLLYFFRQVNDLPKTLFIHGHEIFSRDPISLNRKLRDDSINRYIFIDDFCGSGKQAKDYSKNLVEEMKQISSSVKIYYFPLFATEDGLKNVKDNCKFDKIKTVKLLDKSFKCFVSNSRYFTETDIPIDKNFCEQMCRSYGARWFSDPENYLGYKDGQLLISFHHNTPDNTLPVIWSDREWDPFFVRYNKIY